LLLVFSVNFTEGVLLYAGSSAAAAEI